MKIKSKNNHKKQVLIALSIILTAAIAAASFYLYSNRDAHLVKQSSTNEPTKAKSDDDQAKALQENPDYKSNPVNTDIPPTQNPVENPSDQATMPMVVSTDGNQDSLYIRGGLNGIAYNGSCYALLNGPDVETLRKNTDVMQNPSSTDCKTITINKNELSKGRWTVTLNFTSDKIIGKSNEVSFNI